MRDAVITHAVRTPVGRFGGALASVRPDDLAALVIGEVVRRAGIAPTRIEDVILGAANQAGEDNRNVARMAALLAGLPETVAGVTVNRLCASGLEAIVQACRAVQLAQGDVFLAGGVESMTRAPYVLGKAARGFDRTQQLADTTIGWRFPNPRLAARYPLEGMGETAENVAEQRRDSVSRARQDAFALESQRRAVAAIDAGHFRAEIVPVPVTIGQETRRVDTDEHPRGRHENGRYVLDTSFAQLNSLAPAFRAGGSVTAGNSSGINDGAAAVLVMAAETARDLGLQPLARFVTAAVAGVSPRLMGLGPIPASQKALERAGLTVPDLELIEINEAFAAQVLPCMDDLGLPADRTNVNGGAIALGHPLGCTGARLFTTWLHEMQRRAAHDARSPYGLITMCIGVGQGAAAVFEFVG